MEYKVELSERAWESCRRKPTAVLLERILSLRSGDKIVVEGEELLYPGDKVRMLLEAEGLEVKDYENDGITYRIVAVKKG